MEEIKEENVLNEFRVRGEGLCNALDKVNAHVSDIIVFNVQWKDLNEYLESVKGKLKERFRELESKEVELKEKSFGLEERAKVVEKAEAKLADLEVKSDGFQMEVEERKKELNAEEVRLSQLRTLVEECVAEKVLKASELSEMAGSWRKTHVELGLKGEELAKMETDLERCSAEVSAEMEILSRTQTHRRQLDEEVETKTKDLTLVQTKLVECEKLIETSSSELFKTLEELECKRVNLGQMEAELKRHRVKVSTEKEHWERTRSHSRELEEEISRKKKNLIAVRDKIADSGMQLESVIKQLDSKQKLLETRSSELVSKEKELEALVLDIGLKEQKVMSLDNDMKKTRQRMESKAKELENVQTLIEERNAQCESLKLLIEKHIEQLASAEIAPGVSALPPVNNLSLDVKIEDVKIEEPISNSVVYVRQDITSSHFPNEDAPLRDIEDSTSLSLNEVSTELRMFEDPGRFVLTSVEKALTDASERGELSLEEPILMPLVPLLEELAHVGISTDPDLQSDATKLVDRWVEMMGARVENSQLEAWAVLQFIVAFGLLEGTKQDQILQLASYVAHFKHAPELFESLGLSHDIPNFVTQLFSKGLYIPAIRLMFTFNVKNNFSPLELLKVQIINLRRLAKDNRRYESQAEEANRDASTMMDIMELIEDFQLEIDIPADLILKFMVPASSVPVRSTRMQASDTVIQSSCIATHGSNLSLPTSFGTVPYQAGGSSTALLQGQQHSHHAGSKRPRVDPRPVTRPYFSPPSGFG